MTRCLLPSAGSPGSGSPASSVLLDTPTPHRPSPLASFPSLGSTAPASRASLPGGAERSPSRAWALVPGPPTGFLGTETMRPPRFLGNPKASAPRSSTPAGPRRQAVTASRCCRSLIEQRRLPRRLPFRGSITRLARFPVYASQCGSPHPTQDSVPAGGQPLPGRIPPAGSLRRFRPSRSLLSLASPFTRLPWRTRYRHRCRSEESALSDAGGILRPPRRVNFAQDDNPTNSLALAPIPIPTPTPTPSGGCPSPPTPLPMGEGRVRAPRPET